MGTIDRFIRNANHKRINFFRTLKVKAFLLLFNKKNQMTANFRHNSVLILRLDGKLGDSISISGFLKELEQSGYEVTIICRQQQSFVYDFIPVHFKIIKVDHFFEVILTLIKLQFRKPFMWLICTSHILDLASLILSRFVKASHKIAFQNLNLNFFDHHVNENFDHIHITSRFESNLKIMGIQNRKYFNQYFLHYDTNDINKAIQQISDMGLQSRKYIVINSFAGSRDRNMSFALTQKIVQRLNEILPEYLVVSMASQSDQATLDEWKKNNTNKKWMFSSFSDFATNSILLRESRLVITPDTAIVHLASAMNCTVVGLYRVAGEIAEYPDVWAPLLPLNQFKIVYAFNGQLEKISVEQVASSALELVTNQI